MTETVTDSSTSLGMTKDALESKRTFWALAAIMLVLLSITNLPWHLDDYDQAKQAWTSYEMVTEGHWFYQRTSDDQGLATKPPLIGWDLGGDFYDYTILGCGVATTFAFVGRAHRSRALAKRISRLRKSGRPDRLRCVRFQFVESAFGYACPLGHAAGPGHFSNWTFDLGEN